MDRTEMLQRMHAVLDGEASSEERAALDRVLAQDPQARAQFADLERLFGALDGMPRVEPPEGFADDVMTAMQRSKPKGASTRQPFAQSGVIAPTGSDIRVRASSKPSTARTPSGTMWGRQDMSKRGYWIIGGVAAAVLALFVGTAVDFPASGDKAAGTIVPAERVRNAQPGADEIKIGRPASERAPAPPVPLATGEGTAPASGLNANAAGQSSAGVDARQRSAAEMDARQRSSAEMDARQRSSAEMDARQRSSAEMDARQRSSAEMDARQRSAAEMDARQRSSAEMDARQRSAAEMDARQRSAAEMDARYKK
jgi:hypothetical protein